jgi:hypothetical protein
MQTSTLEGNSLFFQALKGPTCSPGWASGDHSTAVLSLFGLPVLLIYGVVRGLGQSTPHGMILEVAGALLGRYFFPEALRRHVAPVRAGAAGRLFLRHGADRHVSPWVLP